MLQKEQPAILIRFQFRIGSTRNAEMGYRFDDKSGHEPTVRIVEGYRSLVIDDKDKVTRFVNEMAASNALYLYVYLHLRIRARNAPRTSFEFQLNGAPEAMAAACASCPPVGAAKTSFSPPPARRAVTED